ncbi:MAG: ISNCY family transposase [Aestuariibacter sp.]|nr:ISNCY family transposase [Aestuariibacter sp.]
MRRTKVLQEVRMMRFEEAYSSWTQGRLNQEEAARLLGVCDRSFRRYINRYHENGLDGLIDKRLEQVSHKRAPVDEVMAMTERYRSRHMGWNVKHYYSWYKQDGGKRSYSWVKQELQQAGLVKKAPGRGKHRKRRSPSPMPGMIIHQDGSTHEWVAGKKWDLIVTMDDATNEHYSIFLVQEEGTASSFQGVEQVIASQGLFCSFYSDRGSHYWHTPQAGGKVDKTNPTQFGRAMQQLGIQMIASYSPEARGRSERAFKTHQGRLPKELALHGITTMDAANEYIKKVYLPRFNAEFTHRSMEKGTAFVPFFGGNLADILCEQHDRVVGNDNCVEFERKRLQIPANQYRMHYVKVRVRVHRYQDGSLAVFHGPRKLACYSKNGELSSSDMAVAA